VGQALEVWGESVNRLHGAFWWIKESHGARSLPQQMVPVADETDGRRNLARAEFQEASVGFCHPAAIRASAIGRGVGARAADGFNQKRGDLSRESEAEEKESLCPGGHVR